MLDLEAPHHFAQMFGRKPEVCSYAPGRVNLIGEHIDYLGGTVAPMAINRGVRAWIAPNGRPICRISTLQFTAPVTRRTDAEPGPAIFETLRDRIEYSEKVSWANYPLGVVHAFQARGLHIPGFDMLLDGDVAPGSGLSSSAAVELATASALNHFIGAGLTPTDLALMAQSAERHFVGVPCGIMDQAASACCRAGHVLLLDCTTVSPGGFALRHVPLPAGAAIIVAHCGIERRLDGSDYETRQIECAQALARINQLESADYRHLARVPLAAVNRAEEVSAFMGNIWKRARYAVEEQERVERFSRALEAESLEEAGQWMNLSHAGLRDLYEVSTPELDELTEIARDCKGVYGSRLTGAGFGGCAVSLVRQRHAEEIIAGLRAQYYKPRGLQPLIFSTPAMNGVEACTS